MRRRGQVVLVGPPERATKADFYRLFLGFLMVPLGITILVRSFAAGIYSVAAILMGVVFILFGAYRLYTGIMRYKMWLDINRKE
jgi:hypothetical protein